MKKGTLLGSMVGCCLIMLLAVSNTLAQATTPQYDSLPIADEFKDPAAVADQSDRAAVTQYDNARRAVINKRRNMQTSVSDLLKGRSSQVTPAEMDAWFNGYIIPKMTQTDERSLSELGKDRENFFRLYLNVANNAQLRQRVIELFIPAMQQVAEGNYHPVSRVNAIVLLSELNNREGNRSAGQLPVPNPQVLSYLRNVVTQDSFPYYLKAPALAGIERHAAVRGPATSQPFQENEAKAIGGEMVALIEANPEAAEIDPDLVAWNKRRAIRILGFLGRPGDNGEFAQLLRGLIFNDDLDTRTRMDAVAAYGMLDFSGKEEMADIRNVAYRVAELVAKAADDEAKYIDKKISDIRMTVRFLDGRDPSASDDGQKKKSSVGLGQGADSGNQGGNMAGQKKDVPEILPTYQRELVKQRFKNNAWMGRVALIGNTRVGLRGLKSYVAANSEEAEMIDALVKDIDNLMQGTDVKEPEPRDEDDDDEDAEPEPPRTISFAEELKQELVKGSKNIQATLKGYAPKDAAGEAGADSAGEPAG